MTLSKKTLPNNKHKRCFERVYPEKVRTDKKTCATLMRLQIVVYQSIAQRKTTQSHTYVLQQIQLYIPLN